jgi:hypothetical protein
MTPTITVSPALNSLLVKTPSPFAVVDRISMPGVIHCSLLNLIIRFCDGSRRLDAGDFARCRKHRVGGKTLWTVRALLLVIDPTAFAALIVEEMT